MMGIVHRLMVMYVEFAKWQGAGLDKLGPRTVLADRLHGLWPGDELDPIPLQA